MSGEESDASLGFFSFFLFFLFFFLVFFKGPGKSEMVIEVVTKFLGSGGTDAVPSFLSSSLFCHEIATICLHFTILVAHKTFLMLNDDFDNSQIV